MNTLRHIKTRHPALIMAVAILLMAAAGCGDDPVAPCLDCGDGTSYVQVMQRDFTVESAATVEVENFTGKVTYRIGDAGAIHVKATRRAQRQGHLDDIDVEWIHGAGGIRIVATNPEQHRNASVDFEITAPADAVPHISTAVGDIDYRGRPTGNYHFRTGVGTIRLRLPATVNLIVDLSAAVGSIYLGIPVDGSVSTRHLVRGRIGNGDEGSVHASTAVGSIHLIRL
jgi:hypothetical protein